MPERYNLNDLLYLMQRLRTPDTGCPWDLEQDYDSITASTIEEAYEVVDAIEQKNYTQLKEELGDLVFQAVFYARLAEEENRFNFADIIHTLTDKLVRRHPHVFPDGTLMSTIDKESDKSTTEVLASWEAIKQKERQQKGQQGLLDDVPVALPALQRAQKLQKRVAKAGMDYRSVDAVLNALEGELKELREATLSGDAQHIEEELGDVLFSCVNVCRHLKCDADTALRKSNTKFSQRIHAMTTLIGKDKQQLDALDDDVLDRYWQAAKQSLSSSQ